MLLSDHCKGDIMPDRCVGGRWRAHIDQVEASLIPASPKKPSKACSGEMFDSEDSALGVPFQKSSVVPDTCFSHQVCGWGREKHKESYILKWIASSRKGQSLGEYDSLNVLKCWQLWDTVMPVLSDTENKAFDDALTHKVQCKTQHLWLFSLLLLWK